MFRYNLNFVVKFILKITLNLAFLHLTISASVCPPSLQNCEVCDIQINQTIRIENCGTFECHEKVVGALPTSSYSSEKVENDIGNVIATNPAIHQLVIRNVPLRRIPAELCALKALETLILSHNCLIELPANCLNNFASIRVIEITTNQVETLSDGVFDGLNSLGTLSLAHNRIKTIGEKVFSNKSDLLSLKDLNLEYNLLNSVGPWPFIRGMSVNTSRINLKRNNISTFTNAINWKFSCRDRPQGKDYNFEINLQRNKIIHLTDITKPYFNNNFDLMCMYGRVSESSVYISVRGNPIICDCLDYPIVSLSQMASYSTVLDDVHCSEPPYLKNKKIMSVPLDEFKCNITNNCPPGCKCVEQPSSSTLFVDCSNSYLGRNLPDSLPSTHLKKFHLKFNGNALEKLERRSYFENTHYLDLSHTTINSISQDFFDSIKKVKTVFLHSNRLQNLPREVCLNETLPFEQISLYDNPWNCNCENKWFKACLNEIIDKLKSPGSIACHTPNWLKGKNIFKIDDQDFCVDPNSAKQSRWMAATLTPLLFLILLVSFVVFLVWKFKVEINATFNIHLFDRDECEGEEMLYDMFLSCSYDDRKFGIDLVHNLESKGYRVCYHEKDFHGGLPIVNNICWAVSYSRRVACILTRSFIESSYCRYEFEMALHRNITMKKNRLIVLLCGSMVVDKEALPESIYEFLTSHTYVEVKEDKKWTNQLYYSLPINKIKKVSSDTNLPGFPEVQPIFAPAD